MLNPNLQMSRLNLSQKIALECVKKISMDLPKIKLPENLSK